MPLPRRTRIVAAIAAAAAVLALAVWCAPAVGACCAQLARQASAPVSVAPLEDGAADQVAAVEVGNYPTLGAAGSRVTEDSDIVSEALDAFGAAPFSRWDGEAARLLLEGLVPPAPSTGGYFSHLVFLDGSDEALATVSYDSDQGIYLRRNGCIYVADDQEALQDLLNDLVSRAREQGDLPPAADGSRTWWYPDDWETRPR